MLARALLLASATAASFLGVSATEHEYEVKNVVRSIELAGGVSRINTAWSISRPTDDVSQPFYAAVPAEEWDALSSFELSVKRPKSLRNTALAYADAGADPVDNSTHLLALDLSSLPASEPDVTLSIQGTYTHLTSPLPQTAPQNSPQFLAWNGDAGIRSFYPVRKGRTEVTLTSTNIPDFAPSTATKLGNKVKFGPYTDIAPHSQGTIEQGFVRFEHPASVLTVVSVDRTAELSHWASNVAVEDRAWIRNDGPQLEGHFGRVDYQAAAFGRVPFSPTTLVRVRVPLPPGAKDAYVVDTIGNVSTSRFAEVPPNPDLIARPVQSLNPSQASVLDLQPRYPVMGGWNYTFSYGFNLEAGRGGWGKVLGQAGRFSVAVPFLTPIDGGSAYDDVTLRVVLPEGAEDVEVFVPFEVDEQNSAVTKTYLDSTGRQTVILRKKNCTEKNSQLVYVHYSLSTFATLQKPVVASTFTLSLLLVVALLRRFDLRIKSPKQKSA